MIYIVKEISCVSLVFQLLMTWGKKEIVVATAASKPILVIQSILLLYYNAILNVAYDYFKYGLFAR